MGNPEPRHRKRAPAHERSHFTPEQQAEIGEMLRAYHTPIREAFFRAAITLARALRPDLPWSLLKQKVDD